MGTDRPTLWQHRDFRLFWGGQAVSELGGAVTQVALPLAAVVTLHASAFQVGLLTAATTAAFLLVGLPAGAIIDRRRRRPVLITADIGRALLFGSIPLAAALGHLTLVQLYVVALAGGALRVFFDVSYQSYLPALVARDQLVEGNSKLSTTDAAAQVVGPGIGGALVGAIGAAATMTIDALSYVVSFVSLIFIRTKEPAVEPPAGGHLPLRVAIVEGLSFVRRQPILFRITGCTAIANLSSGIMGGVESIFMIRTLHMTPGLFGLVFTVVGIGSVIGAVVAPRMATWLGLGPAIITGVTISAIGALLWPFASAAQPFPLLAGGGALMGLGAVAYNVNQVSMRQAITPSRLLGRMNASVRFVVWGVTPIGGVIGGVLGTALGIRPTVWIGALLGLACVPWIALSPVRHLRETPEPVEPELAPTH